MGKTVALWRFDETATTQRCQDVVGNVLPLNWRSNDPDNDLPASVAGLVGRARMFSVSDTKAFAGRGVDAAAAGKLALRRSMTIEALCHYVTATDTAQTIIAHGLGNAVEERQTWFLQVVNVAGVDCLRFGWSAGDADISDTYTQAAVPDLAITIPVTGWMYIAAVREWLSATEVQIHWHVNGEYVGTVISNDGQIEVGQDGEVTIGARFLPGGSDYEAYWANEIDQIRVSDGVRTAEEIRQIYRRIFVFSAYGLELLNALLPPGDAYSTAPTSQLQRELAVQGDGLSVAWSKAAELRDDFLPDRAWSFLDLWERVTRLSPKPGDSIETRRARVVAFLGKVQGYSRTDIRAAVADLLDCAAADLEILENSTTLTDEFTTAGQPWWLEEANDGGISPGAGSCLLDVTTGGDARWDSSVRNAVSMRTSIEADTGVEVWAIVHVADLVLAENTAAGGIAVWNQVTGDAHLFGVKNDAGTVKWWHATIIGGVKTEHLGAAAPGGTHYKLRYIDRGSGTADLDVDVDLSGNYTTLFAGVTTCAARQWAVPFLTCATNPTTADNAILFARTGVGIAFSLHAPDGRHIFEWFIFRDPALGGTPDLVGAQLVIDGMKPAQTRGAIAQARVALYDDPATGYDRTPYGG